MRSLKRHPLWAVADAMNQNKQVIATSVSKFEVTNRLIKQEGRKSNTIRLIYNTVIATVIMTFKYRNNNI